MWRRSAPADGHDDPRPPSSPPSTLLRSTAVAVVLALPVLAWLLRAHGARLLANALSLLLVVAALGALTRAFGMRTMALIVAGVLAVIAAAAALGLPPIYWPPVAMNLAIAALFGVTLHRGEPLVTQFARLERTPLTPRLARYCRRLTVVWTLYLTVLGCIGIAIAVHGDEHIGAWWCGIVNYALVAALFLGERLVRPVDSRASLFEQARNVVAVLRGPRV